MSRSDAQGDAGLRSFREVFRNGSESSLNAVCRSGEPISPADLAPQPIRGSLLFGTRPVQARCQEVPRCFLPSRLSQANENPRPLRYLTFRRSIPHPMQSLCTLRHHCRQWPRNTRCQADATPYLGRTFTGWIAPACGWRTHSITSSARASSVGGTSRLSALAVERLITNSNLLDWTTGRSAGLAP